MSIAKPLGPSSCALVAAIPSALEPPYKLEYPATVVIIPIVELSCRMDFMSREMIALDEAVVFLVADRAISRSDHRKVVRRFIFL